jgi:hypothetical protein
MLKQIPTAYVGIIFALLTWRSLGAMDAVDSLSGSLKMLYMVQHNKGKWNCSLAHDINEPCTECEDLLSDPYP